MTATGIAVAGAGEHAVGVLQDKPDAAGRAGGVMMYGITKCKAGAAVAVNALVTPDASGRAVTAASNDFIFGIALEAAANADEIIAVALQAIGELN
jgi:DNA-binding transcriptional regulator LsrR (DeoR family)